MSEDDATDSGNRTSEQAACSVPSCQHSPQGLQQWQLTTCQEHEGQTHVSCGCKPIFSLHPLPPDEQLREKWAKALKLEDGGQSDNQIWVCSLHFVDGKPTESDPVPVVLEIPAENSQQKSSSVVGEPAQDEVSNSVPSQDADPNASGEGTLSQDTVELTDGLKRPLEDTGDEGPSAKKPCVEIKKEDAAGNAEKNLESQKSEPPVQSVPPVQKTTQGRPKYRASSPTIMTTRGKSQKDIKGANKAAVTDGNKQEGSLADQHSPGDGQRKRNGTSCVVPGCRITGWSNPEVKWYRIPKDERLREIWLTHIGRPDFDPREYHRICSTHFAGGRKTFDSIIPTIGVPTSSKKSKKRNKRKSDAVTSSSSPVKITLQNSVTAAVAANKKAFLSNKLWYSRWPITGNNTGSMCCIPGCKSTRRRNLALKYYRFPKEDTLRQQWLASVGLRNFMPRDNSRVCSTHFEGGARSDKNSVPTVFSTDTIALRNTRYEQQHQVKQEPEENKEETTVSKDQAFHRQISPRKQAVPHRHPKAGHKTSGNSCCVAGCNSKWVNNHNLSFYRIPRKSKPELRRQWIKAIGSRNITSSESRVCSLHFKGGRKTELNPVPTIFPGTSGLTDTGGTLQGFSNQYVKDWEKHRPMSTPQSNIETLLQASDILSQREAESRSNTPPSSSPMKDQGDGSHLPPETPRGSSCMVPGCGNTRSNSKGRLRWYRVPKDESRRKLWLSAIGWPNAVPTDTTRICSAHFVEGIYRKKGDKAVPTIFPPKPKHWHERHPQMTEGMNIQPKQEIIPYVDPSSPSFSPSPPNPSSPGVNSFQGDQQQSALPFVTRNHFEAHPYGPTMLHPEMFERSPKQQSPGESRGVTCCVARCHNNTKRSPGLRWYRIPADPTVRQMWIDFICRARPDFAPKNHHRVCSAHFVGGMKFSKTHVPSVYDKPYNRRFLPPTNYQRPEGGEVEQQQQDVFQQEHGWQKQELQETHHHQSEPQELNKQRHLISGALSRQRWPRPAGDVAGPSRDAPMDLSKQSKMQNPSSPISTRSILPLTYRESQEQVFAVQPKQETEVLHDLSTPFNGQFNNLYPAKTSDDDLTLSGVLPPGMIELKKRVGGGGQCFVPRCTNTRRHNPGLKWYRIPKDPDLRTLWLDNIGRPDAEPKAHNRVCSDHFEGGYKQFNTSLPTIEKWSETKNHVYTGRVVVDPCSSAVGSTMLAVDSNPISVDASTSKLTPTVAEMQSLADSLTALAAELDIAADSVDGTLPEGATTPPITSAHDYSMTSDSLTTTNSDNLPISLEASTSQTGSSSSSVATYASSPEACTVMSPLKVDTDLPQSVPKMDPSNRGAADVEFQSVSGGDAGCLEVGSISTPIYTSPSKHPSRHRSSSSQHENQDGSSAIDANLEFTDTSLITIAVDHPTEHKKEGHEDAIASEKDPEQLQDAPKLEEGNPKERVKYLEGLVQSMCEEMRIKDQRLQEKDFDLTSCRQRLKEKEAECERLKRKCLMMSVRLGSFRKLAQTDL